MFSREFFLNLIYFGHWCTLDLAHDISGLSWWYAFQITIRIWSLSLASFKTNSLKHQLRKLILPEVPLERNKLHLWKDPNKLHLLKTPSKLPDALSFIRLKFSGILLSDDFYHSLMYTYFLADLHTCLHTCTLHKSMWHAYMQALYHACIHAYIKYYIFTRMHTYLQLNSIIVTWQAW